MIGLRVHLIPEVGDIRKRRVFRFRFVECVDGVFRWGLLWAWEWYGEAGWEWVAYTDTADFSAAKEW